MPPSKTKRNIGNKMRKSPGRPPRTIVGLLRAMVWIRQVLSQSGASSPTEFEARRSPEAMRIRKGKKKPSSGKYRNYFHGRNTPNLALVLEIDAAYPGSADWYLHDFWRVIDRPGVSAEDLRNLMQRFNPILKMILFEPTFGSAIIANPHKRRTLNKTEYREIHRQGDLEALTCLFALIREAELSGDEHAHRYAAQSAVSLILTLLSFNALFEVSDLLWNYVDKEFFSRTYKSQKPLWKPEDGHQSWIETLMMVGGDMEDVGISDGTYEKFMRLLFFADTISPGHVFRDLERMYSEYEKDEDSSENRYKLFYEGIANTPSTFILPAAWKKLLTRYTTQLPGRIAPE